MLAVMLDNAVRTSPQLAEALLDQIYAPLSEVRPGSLWASHGDAVDTACRAAFDKVAMLFRRNIADDTVPRHLRVYMLELLVRQTIGRASLVEALHTVHLLLTVLPDARLDVAKPLDTLMHMAVRIVLPTPMQHHHAESWPLSIAP